MRVLLRRKDQQFGAPASSGTGTVLAVVGGIAAALGIGAVVAGRRKSAAAPMQGARKLKRNCNCGR